MYRGLLATVCLCCVACAQPRAPTNPAAGPDEYGRTVYLANHGWHAGLVLRRADIPAGVWPEQEDFADAQYLEVGWGDGDFYQTPQPHWGVFLKAALLPTEGVLHLVGFSGSIPRFFPGSEVVAIRLSESGFSRLCDYIAASHQRDPGDGSVSLGPGLYGSSRFYRSHQTYHLFNNCNAWTARGLQTAGCPIDPAYILTVDDLMAGARACGEVFPTRPGTQAQ